MSIIEDLTYDTEVTTPSQDNQKTYKVYPLKTYNASAAFIQNGYEEYTLEELTQRLMTQDRGYHVRIHNGEMYNLFGDLDNYLGGFPKFLGLFLGFLQERYSVVVLPEQVSYTQNKSKEGSYHYSIPSVHCSCEQLKNIHSQFINENRSEFVVDKHNAVDTTVYSEHWFRLPMQSKESVPGTCHDIVVGCMSDFIPEYIPVNSLMLTCPPTVTPMVIQPRVHIQRSHDDQLKMLRKFIDECYKKSRMDDYNEWIHAGMAMYSAYSDAGFELFDYFSSKSSKYDGTDATRLKYQSFQNNSGSGYTVSTLFYNAKKDNPTRYKEIISDSIPKFTEHLYAKKIFELAGDRFIYLIEDSQFVLYSYIGSRWIKRDESRLRKYMSEDLSDYYESMYTEMYKGTPLYNICMKNIEDLQNSRHKKGIAFTYREHGLRDDIKFDNNIYLLGFNNGVYDLETCEFRGYQYSDYVTMTTGYDYIIPTQSEITKVQSMIDITMPVLAERNLYMQIMCSALVGKTMERFFVWTGDGANGKGALDDLYLNAFGDYGIVANNAILSETNKMGACPEKANMHKKRLIVFREPSEKARIQNSILKDLTGSLKFTCRGLYEGGYTEKDMYGTIILETNKKPLLAESPTHAEDRRIIDIPFRATFTTYADRVDHSRYIYAADHELKSARFHVKHRCAMMKIMMDYYRTFSQNNFVLDIPKHIEQRTSDYLAESCDVLQWFTEVYSLSEDPNEVLKTKHVHSSFINSAFFRRLTKADQNRYTKYGYFADYLSRIPLLRNFCNVTSSNVKIIKGYTLNAL